MVDFSKIIKQGEIPAELDGAVLTPESMKRALKNGYSDKEEIKRMFEGFSLDVIPEDYED